MQDICRHDTILVKDLHICASWCLRSFWNPSLSETEGQCAQLLNLEVTCVTSVSPFSLLFDNFLIKKEKLMKCTVF